MLDASLVENLPPFMNMDPTDIQRLLDLANSARYEKGTVIFSEGQAAEHFYLLLDGHVRVARKASGGQQVIVRYVASGELLGLAQALRLETYPADAVAVEDCVVFAWDGAHWPGIAEDHPTFASNTYHTIGTRMKEAHDRIVELATQRVEQRVATALAELARQAGKTTEAGVRIEVPLTRKDIAEMTATTLHTASRLLSKWEGDGLIGTRRQKITILDQDGLRTLATAKLD